MVRKLGKTATTMFIAVQISYGIYAALAYNTNNGYYHTGFFQLFYANLARYLLFGNFVRMGVVLLFDLLNYYFPSMFYRLFI